MKTLSPSTIRPPAASYSHGVEVPAGARLAYVSGQLGVAPDGSVPEGGAEQVALCFANVAAVLAEAGMALTDVVRINAYVSERAVMKDYMSVRDALFPAPFPASTLLVVSGFAREEFKVEIEVVAAKVA